MSIRALVITCGVDNKLVDTVLDNTDYDIEYAFVGYIEEKRRLEERTDCHRIKNIYVCEHATLWNEKDISVLDYEKIAEYKEVEADFYDGTHRYVNDYNITKILYYNALNFWLKIFDDHEFDLVILQELTHGVSHDVIPINIAKKLGIPCYQIEPLAYKSAGIYLNNIDEYIKTVEHNHDDVDVKRLMYYKMETEIYNSSNAFKKVCKSACEKIGGTLLVNTIRCLKKHTTKIYIFDTPLTEHTLWDNIRSAYKCWSANRYLKKLAVEPNLNCNYVVYYMHLEPEASIMVRCPIKTQLLAIQMLAESLPVGYTLYVKEHPHQTLFNTEVFWDNLYTQSDFKTKKFYDYISNLPNTYLVSGEYPSSKLTSHAKAIATYMGTVALESVNSKKPCLLFAHNKSIFRYVKGILGVRSIQNCREILDMVAKGFTPEYTINDFRRVSDEYLFPWNTAGLTIAVKSINKHYNEFKEIK